jgi:hypothetical protein
MINYDFKKLREINLSNILLEIFNAQEIGTNELYGTRKFFLAPDRNIAVTNSKWIDNTTSTGGYGAIDLVMYIKGISVKESADLLYNRSELNCNNRNYTNLISHKIILPERCSYTWLSVKMYLTKLRSIPEYLIDYLYNQSLIWSDKNRNCVFPRDLESGAYLRGTFPGIPFKMTLGRNGRPYVIPGDNLIIITEAPIDAISLKYFYNQATILATGGRIGFDKIEPYLINAYKVLLGHDNDKSGDEQALNISAKININCERLRPMNNCKDWNDVLKLEINNKCKNKIE